MSVPAHEAKPNLPSGIADAYTAVCGYIAPAWPLDRQIAVNPFWELRGQTAADVAARLSALARAELVMPPAYYASLQEQPIRRRHLDAAAAELDIPYDPNGDDHDDASLAHWHNVSDLLDSGDVRRNEMPWREEIVHQISQFCADVLRPGGALGEGAMPGSLYSQWLDAVEHDHGIAILMGERALRARFGALPGDAAELLAVATGELGISESAAELYAHALLLDVNGWASWLAYLRWQGRLSGSDNDLTQDLLAIRMAWDLTLWRHVAETDRVSARRVRFLWQRQIAAPDRIVSAHRDHQRRAWLWQRAAELAYQETMAAALSGPTATASAEAASLELQAVFCIDVRSEVIRRHLEFQDRGIRTLGFAGFFGLPLAYRPAGTDVSRPQLPGLLAPTIEVTESHCALPAREIERAGRWSELGDTPAAMFGLVEASGPLYVLKLLRDGFLAPRHEHPVDSLHERCSLELYRDGVALSIKERAELATAALRGMGLDRDFAPVVLLVGHGSVSRNNPHAASLDCGACGGHTGQINSRVLAQILNDPEVRCELRECGIRIPEVTRFVAAVHNTTTDEIDCFEPLPARVRRWLDAAGEASRRERAARLGLAADDRLAARLKRRSRDWAELRPEWGLAGNAAFVAAPREITRHRDLAGRAFLHDYDWQNDTDGSLLEQIMTAPMIVANWINAQYNASVTDNAHYGSGNKLLHNVVGGCLGVFEGNGGDLRIGLPWQSVHDGSQFMHTPLRLSVYIAAPTERIQRIYRHHAVVHDLVDNDWLFLFRLDEEHGVQRLYRNHWSHVPVGEID